MPREECGYDETAICTKDCESPDQCITMLRDRLADAGVIPARINVLVSYTDGSPRDQRNFLKSLLAAITAVKERSAV